MAIHSGIAIFSLQDIHCFEELPETQNTLEGNALQKAKFVYEKYEYHPALQMIQA